VPKRGTLARGGTPILRAALASSSGQGISLTHRHSADRVLERAPSIFPIAQRQGTLQKTAVRYLRG
jgi:hypothetical protein